MEPVAKDCLNYRCWSLRAGSRLAPCYDSCVWLTSWRPDTQGDCVGAAGILELFASSTSALQLSEGWMGVTANNPQVSLFDLLVWPQRLFLILGNCRTQFSWVYICTLDSSFICPFQIQQRFALLSSSLLLAFLSSWTASGVTGRSRPTIQTASASTDEAQAPNSHSRLAS